MPFGEYVPWRDELSWISAIRAGAGRPDAGGAGAHRVHRGAPRVRHADLLREQLPVADARDFVRDGAGFLVVPVNNASYGTTAASAQHLQMSRMRAVENGRWVVNAAVSGISAFIDPSGRVVAEVGPVPHRDPAAHDPFVRRRHAVRPVGGLVPVALARDRGRHGAGASQAHRRPCRSRRRCRRTDAGRSSSCRRTRSATRSNGCSLACSTFRSAWTSWWSTTRRPTAPDGSCEAVAADEPRVRLLERPRKSGLASAYLDGFRVGVADGYDLLVEMDSDLSHQPEELSRLLEAAASGRDLVVGSRYVPGGSVTDWSRSRVALSKAGNAYARLMLGVPIRDATSGFRVYRREALTELTERPVPLRRLRVPDRAGDAGVERRLRTSARCRSRSANANTATRRSPARSSSRRSGWSRCGV